MIINKFGKTFKVKQWSGEKLKSFSSIDTEGELIKSPDHTPRLVVTTAYDGGDTIYIVTNSKVKEFLTLNHNSTMFLHNFPFDENALTTLCGYEWWNKIEQDKIFDTILLYRLYYIATKGFVPEKYSLDRVFKELFNYELPKDDDIRLTFGQFLREDGSVDYKALSKSKAHIEYACLDPVATYMIGMSLLKKIKLLQTSTNLAHRIHLMGACALASTNRNGIEVDLEYTSKLRESILTPLNQQLDIMATYGYVKGQKGNTKVYEDICDSVGVIVPKSPKAGKYSQAEEHLEKYKHIPFIKAFLGYKEHEKAASFLNLLTESRVYPWYDSLKITGRSSCSKPNMQNPPRVGGIRECFIPKEGHVFCDVDYGSIEMFTMADILKKKYGQSNMYDVLQSGQDPHCYVATLIYNIPYKEIYQKAVVEKIQPYKDWRQASKIANYGFLANMSEETFIEYAKQFGVEFTYEKAKKIKAGWKKAYPEIVDHWKDAYRNNTFISTTGFIRANCISTEWLNTHFQGRAAEGAKIALYLAYKEGLKIVSFVHDQIIIESKKEVAKEELKLLQQCMIEGMKMVCPMNIQAEGEIKERYSK